MKDYYQPGEALELTAPSGGVVSGTAYLIGTLVVVATTTVAQTLKFVGLVEGVVIGAKDAEEVWTENQKIYYVAASKTFTNVADSNVLVGVAVTPKALNVGLASDALVADLTIVGNVITILDYAQLATDNAVVTVTINGVATELVAGTDWTAATTNDATATSLASAIDGLTGVGATALTNAVTVTVGTGVPQPMSNYAAASTTGLVRLDGVTR